MIIPITLALAVYAAKNTDKTNTFSFYKVFPWFILGFLAASLLNTTGFIPLYICKILAQTGKFFIVMAMVAIGLNTHLRELINNGFRPILLGLSCWFVVALVSLAAQHFLQMW